nr:MAG TPA: hypothetical protein [Caudoviricetes sp.]
MLLIFSYREHPVLRINQSETCFPGSSVEFV